LQRRRAGKFASARGRYGFGGKMKTTEDAVPCSCTVV